MATKSFFKDIVIDNEEDAFKLIHALEEAEEASKKRKKINVSFETINDKKRIKEMFSRVKD